jgi:hypothetical protein
MGLFQGLQFYSIDQPVCSDTNIMQFFVLFCFGFGFGLFVFLLSYTLVWTHG